MVSFWVFIISRQSPKCKVGLSFCNLKYEAMEKTPNISMLTETLTQNTWGDIQQYLMSSSYGSLAT